MNAPPTKRRRYLALYIVGGLLLAFIAVIWSFTRSGVYHEARRLGMPLEEGDLFQTPMPDPTDNAAALADEMLTKMNRKPRMGGAILMGLAGQNMTPEEAAKELAQLDEALALAEAAAEKEVYRSTRNWNVSFSTIPMPNNHIAASQLLASRGVWHAQNGRMKEAIADIRRSSAFAKLMLQDPVMLSLSQGMAAEVTAWRGACYAAVYADAAELAELKSIVESRAEPRLVDYLGGELVLAAAVGRNGLSGASGSGPPSGLIERYMLNQTLKDMMPIYRLSEAERTNEAVDPILRRRWERQLDSLLLSGSSLLILTTDNLRVHEAYQTTALAWMAAMAHRQTTGSLPQSLGDLGDYPDPFVKGGSLKMRVDPDGTLRIWSVGKDGVDNSGDYGDNDIAYPVPARTSQ